MLRRHPILIVCCLLILLGVGSGGAALLFVLSGFSGDAKLPADCAVVFGAAIHPVVVDKDGKKFVTSEAGPGIRRRVGTAVSYYKDELIQKMFLSGGRGEGNQRSEAEVMGELARAEGVDPRDIILEDHSHNTEENLLLTRPLTGSCSSIVGISDAYHLARIEFIAHTQGWELSTLPAQGSPGTIFVVQSVIREVGALIMFTIESLLT
ncbi:MAG: YdcF family protein [Candidatus Peribacteraceae bacterium]